MLLTLIIFHKHNMFLVLILMLLIKFKYKCRRKSITNLRYLRIGSHNKFHATIPRAK